MLTDSTLFLLDTMNRIMIEQHGKKLCSVTLKPTSSQTELQRQPIAFSWREIA